MKTSKPAQQTSAQEECGVWLDTVQLKAKQKRLARPISKLLNPFTGGGGYSLAVALNFTQTKMEMPKTKQSSISTFFAPQVRVLNKMSSEVPNMDPVQPCSSSTSATHALTAPNPVVSGTKRKLEMFDLYNSEPGVNHEWKGGNVAEPEAALWQEKAAEEQIEEMNPPQSKRSFIAASSLPGDSQPLPQAWSQDPLLTWSQYSQVAFSPTKTKPKTPQQRTFATLSQLSLTVYKVRTPLEFRLMWKVEPRLKNPLKVFILLKRIKRKKTAVFLSFKSPRKHSTRSHTEPLSDCKCTEPKTASPRKHAPLCMRKRTDKEESLASQFKWTKPSSSPIKKAASKPPCREVDEDSLAMLFTQDSEGFRVIAHRGLQARNPLKDKSNISSVMVRTSAYKSLEEEDEEDEMLFTQDSQGNMVIKH